MLYDRVRLTSLLTEVEVSSATCTPLSLNDADPPASPPSADG